jgi:hypothetical protein
MRIKNLAGKEAAASAYLGLFVAFGAFLVMKAWQNPGTHNLVVETAALYIIGVVWFAAHLMRVAWPVIKQRFSDWLHG